MLSSHLLSDVEAVCTQLVVMNQGEVLYVGSLDAMKKPQETIVEVETKHQNAAFQEILDTHQFSTSEHDGRIHVHLHQDSTLRDILVLAHQAHIQIRHVKPYQQTLETAFLDRITQHQNRK